MEFSKYEKMSHEFSKFKYDTDYVKQQWIVTEKVHGANFSFHTDGKDVRCAKRSAILDPEINFFNYQNAKFIKTYPDKMKDVFVSVTKLLEDKEIIQVSIYGELFGGKYIVDGKDLNIHGVSSVQHEIQYSPNIEWSAFDISYRQKQRPDYHEYLDPEDALKIFEQHDIFYLKPLFVGAMNEALNYPLGFDSTIPNILGLPALPEGVNKAEGVVVRPLKSVKVNRVGEKARVIVKIKLPEFMEITGQQPKIREYTDKGRLLPNVMKYATEQRLANSISKVGDPLTVDIQSIIEEFITDIFTDIEENDKELYEEWSTIPDQNKIKYTIHRKATGLINKFNKAR